MLLVWEREGKSPVSGNDTSISSSVQQKKEYLLGELRNGYTTHHKLKQQITEVNAEVSTHYYTITN